LSANDTLMQNFWITMGELAPKEKSQFLLFVRGGARFQHNDHLTVSRLTKAGIDPDALLPHARTCFFELQLPPYSTRHILKTKLLTAMNECVTMELE